MGQNSYFIQWDYKDWVCYVREEKYLSIDSCCFCCNHFSLFSKSHFTFHFSLFFLFQFPTQIAQVIVLVPLMDTIPIYILNQLIEFLIFTLIVYKPFLSIADTLQRCPLPFWLHGFNLHYPLNICSVFSLSFTTYPMTDSHPIHSVMYLSLSF